MSNVEVKSFRICSFDESIEYSEYSEKEIQQILNSLNLNFQVDICINGSRIEFEFRQKEYYPLFPNLRDGIDLIDSVLLMAGVTNDNLFNWQINRMLVARSRFGSVKDYQSLLRPSVKFNGHHLIYQNRGVKYELTDSSEYFREIAIPSDINMSLFLRPVYFEQVLCKNIASIDVIFGLNSLSDLFDSRSFDDINSLIDEFVLFNVVILRPHHKSTTSPQFPLENIYAGHMGSVEVLS